MLLETPAKEELVYNDTNVIEIDIGCSSNPVNAHDFDYSGALFAYDHFQKMGFDYLKRYKHITYKVTHGCLFKEGIVAVVTHYDYCISFEIFALLEDGHLIIFTSEYEHGGSMMGRQLGDYMAPNSYKKITINNKCSVTEACQKMLEYLLEYNQPHQQLTPDNFIQVYSDFCNLPV